MGTMASKTTSLTIVFSTVYSDADQRKRQSFASLAFVRGFHRGTTQMTSNDENVSIWWRHHASFKCTVTATGNYRNLHSNQTTISQSWTEI